MKILVIGGSGHIGSYLVRELVQKGHTVYAVMRGNRTPYGYEEEVWSKVNVTQMTRAEL